MKIKHLLYFVVLGAAFTACSNDKVIDESVDSQKVSVKLNLIPDAVMDVSSRSTTSMPLEDANKITSAYIIQYNAEGARINVATASFTASVANPYSGNVSLTACAGGTVCVYANYSAGNAVPSWPLYLADLMNTTTVGLPIGSDGLYSGKMLMFGYYKGDVTSSQSLNILMGRMVACIKLVLTASSAKTVTNVTIKNGVKSTHFFPPSDTKSDLTYGTFTDSPNASVSTSSPLTLYYYTGENINPAATNRTSVAITAGGKTYNVDLGADSPNVTSNRNYSLYRNNMYTFNIILN